MSPRQLGQLEEVADLLRQGDSYEQIAEALGLSKSQVYTRVRALREKLAERTGNVAWIREANPVEVGRAWFGEEVREGLAPKDSPS